MEQVLETYKKQYDPSKPLVCMDETSKQLVRETHQPIAPEAGQPLRYDYEYERNGVANLFMFCEPLRGWRRVSVTERRTKVDWAQQIKRLVDEDYPDAHRITLVMDNLNTHRVSSLYEAFPPDEARRLIDKLKIVHTPKHGSWLNIAEIELNVLSRQCLDQRIADRHLLAKHTNAWETDRNATTVKVDWQFRTEDARIKLKRLYPNIQMG
jgi:hypothetical protein